ncbi:MAG: hypothetical protein ABL983_15525 [Nitrospira sp.]
MSNMALCRSNYYQQLCQACPFGIDMTAQWQLDVILKWKGLARVNDGRFPPVVEYLGGKIDGEWSM